MKRQKVFFNDLLALALAGIVSLLFTHGITQFVNTNKKQEQTLASYCQMSDQSEEEENISSSRQVNFPVIGYHFECNLFVHEKPIKILRQVTFDIAWDWKRVKLPRTDSFRRYYNKQTEAWNPSIPITLCKLLI